MQTQTILKQTTPNGLAAGTTQKKAQKLSQFYQDKNILITGCTGFVGKVCLVKLMKSLGNCGQVYVMLRPKKGMTPQQRFNKMLTEEPFVPPKSRIFPEDLEALLPKHPSNDNPADWSKVIALAGDMNSENLGLSHDDVEQLTKSVDIIFNIAASVQFDAPLKQNLRDNYLGARNLLQLATKFEKLISLVHVSTFYTNSHLSHIEEKVIPLERDCEKMAELINWLPDDICDQVAPSIMENRPNTYIFTKAMAEMLVSKYEGRLPIAIVRPSIVVPSVRDPNPGWVDNVNGPMGLGVLASLGILRNIDWNYWGVADLIPVDMVVNNMLAVAERTARLKEKDIKVYNCSSSSLSPATWGVIFESLRTESFKSPPYKMLRIPIEVPRHKRANKVGFALTKLSELLFAYFIDFLLTICGQKKVLTKLTAKLHHGYDILRPFTTNDYTCSNDNLLASYSELCDEDKVEFDFNVETVDWPKGFIASYYGARRLLLREELSNVPNAIFKMKILWAVETVFKLMFFGLIAYAAYRLSGAQSLLR